MLSKMSPVIAVVLGAIAFVGQQTPANPATEFPVLMRQDIIAGKTTVGTKVEAKLVLGTLLNGTVIPKNAILSGEVIESVAKSPTEPSRLAVRMDSVQWKNGSAPVEPYLTSWYYPARAITPDIADRPTASHYDPTSPIYEPLPGSENSPRPVPNPTNRRVLMKNVEGLRRDDGGVVITSKIFNIKINKSTNYVLAASELLPTTTRAADVRSGRNNPGQATGSVGQVFQSGPDQSELSPSCTKRRANERWEWGEIVGRRRA
jgi:hypothetical protein